MVFVVEYSIFPLRAIYRMEVEADSERDAEEKIRMNPDTTRYRIRSIEVKE